MLEYLGRGEEVRKFWEMNILWEVEQTENRGRIVCQYFNNKNIANKFIEEKNYLSKQEAFTKSIFKPTNASAKFLCIPR